MIKELIIKYFPNMQCVLNEHQFGDEPIKLAHKPEWHDLDIYKCSHCGYEGFHHRYRSHSRNNMLRATTYNKTKPVGRK